MKGRATTPEQKSELDRRLLAAWQKVPHLRLGQLIQSVIARAAHLAPRPQGTLVEEEQTRHLYYVEDEAFIEEIERWADDAAKNFA